MNIRLHSTTKKVVIFLGAMTLAGTLFADGHTAIEAAVGNDARPESDRQRDGRSEEHKSELQSHHDPVCRPLLEKKKRV